MFSADQIWGFGMPKVSKGEHQNGRSFNIVLFNDDVSIRYYMIGTVGDKISTACFKWYLITHVVIVSLFTCLLLPHFGMRMDGVNYNSKFRNNENTQVYITIFYV